MQFRVASPIKILVLPILLILIVSTGFSQTYWKIENEKGEEILLTISTDRKNMTFEAHTRKNALKYIAGSITFLAAKTAGILKYPEIIHAEGRMSVIHDTTFYTGSFTYLDESFRFTAKTWSGNFDGTLEDEKRAIHLRGEKTVSDKPLRDYESIIEKAFSLTEKYYFNQEFIKSSDWRGFKNKVNEQKQRISDDYELAATIYWYKKSIPDFPYEIRKTPGIVDQPKGTKLFLPKEIKPKICLADMNNLPDNATGMSRFFEEIQKRKIENLVLDARGRKNLSLNSAMLLACHLTNRSGLWGFYTTRKWTDAFGITHDHDKFKKQSGEFITAGESKKDLYNSMGCVLKVVPAEPVFSGKTFLLISHKTTGIAEAFAIWMKNEKTGILAGQKTAGAPLLSESLSIDKQFYITLPVARFYDKDGKIYLRSGTEPDLKVTGEDALGYVLKSLN